MTNWDTQIFGQVGQNKRHIRARLLGAQRALNGSPNPFLLHLEQHLINQYNNILYQEFLLWQMKSCILWLSYGDAITRFFHIQARIRLTRQHIATLKNYDDEWIQGSQLHEFVVNHFKCLFQSGLNGEEVPPPNTSYSSSEFPFQDFHTTLSRFPDDLEILSILGSMHPLKSPSPYGFHAQFFQNN